MSAPASPAAAETAVLPRLRGDLQLELSSEAGGFPVAVVTDPVRGCYFRLAWPHSGILMHWREAANVAELRHGLAQRYALLATAEDIAAVAEFAVSNQLTETGQGGTWRSYAGAHKAGQHGWLKTAIHGYLFFRVPLLHPERLLVRMLPHLSFAYRRPFWLGVLAVAMLGVYLASRQWTAVVSAMTEAMRLEGLAIYAAAILGLKAVHELGHALTTVRLGCRVPSMGVAFMLGAPVLYTDTTDSWRLPRRSQRLAIVFAGVAAEMIVAALAILLWSFLPDGLLRQICFAIATTSIVLSISVNLNPFMRFDGYFALSDLWQIPNLQARAFALMSWRLRELLFDLGLEAPERLPKRTERLVVAYAVLTAIYRLFLFLGIALIVYLMAGKAIGIVLGLFEIVVFIALPVWRELAGWWQLRAEIARRPRARWTMAAAAALLAACFLPVNGAVEAPAVLLAAQEETIHLPVAARLASIAVRDGQTVAAGDVLFEADARELRQEHAKATLESRALEFQVRRLHASDKERDARGVVESRLGRAREKVAALERQIAQLVIRAPFAGRVVDLDREISEGLWLNPKRPLARVVAASGARVQGHVADGDLSRLRVGARARFIPDDAAADSRPLTLTMIAPASNGRLMEPILADRHGGGIPSAEQGGELQTRQGWVDVSLASEGSAPLEVQRGLVRIDADSMSPAMLVWRQIARVLVREQTF